LRRKLGLCAWDNHWQQKFLRRSTAKIVLNDSQLVYFSNVPVASLEKPADAMDKKTRADPFGRNSTLSES